MDFYSQQRWQQQQQMQQPHAYYQQQPPYAPPPGAPGMYDPPPQSPQQTAYPGFGVPSHPQHLAMPPPLSPVRTTTPAPQTAAGSYAYPPYTSPQPQPYASASQHPYASHSQPQPHFSPQRQHTQPPQQSSNTNDRDEFQSSSENGVCFAADQGLRGKIKLSRDGKHSFVDIEGLSASPSHLPTNVGSTSQSHSLSRSLLELAKTEKARIKAERLAKEKESSRTRTASDRRQSPAANVSSTTDAFNKLVMKEHKARTKYHISERTLLEEERARYTRLEEAYDKLLTQVQQLQAVHLQDVRNTESRFHSASTSLQKALVLKSEETISLSNQLANVQARYERDMREWAKDRAMLLSKVEMTEKAWKEADATLQDREKKINELGRLRKDLSERVATREQELIKYAKALREREGDWMREKETRMKNEVKALKLEETLSERDAEIKSIKDSLEKKQSEIEELSRVRSLLNESKREVEDLGRREKNYLAEIEQTTARERKLFNEVEELSAQQRKYMGEISRLTTRQSALLQDADLAKNIEAQLRQELEDVISKNVRQNQELADLEKQARQFQSDNARLLRDVSEMQAAIQDLRAENQAMDKELSQLRITSETIKSEKEALLAQRSILEADREAKHHEADDLHAKLNEVSIRLESELHSKAEMRQQNKEKLVAVSQRINDLQNTLSETQVQLQDLRENESLLRQTVRQREETIRAQNQSIVELQTKLSDFQSQLSKDNQEFEAFKAKKREEIVGIQDKFNGAKAAMEHEVASLRSQLQQKLTQLTVSSEEASKLKVELSELSADRFSLEARVSELLASEASYQRQISNLQIAINQKNQEIARLTSKQQALAEQLKRLDEEMHAYRTNALAANTRDNEIMRLQSNMEEISKRLKSQVDLLLDRDLDGVRGGSSVANTSMQTNQDPSNMTAGSPGARSTRAYEAVGSSMLFGSSFGANVPGSTGHSRTPTGNLSNAGERNVTFSPSTNAFPGGSSAMRTTAAMNRTSGSAYVASSSAASSPAYASASFPRSLEREASRKIVGIDDFEDADRNANNAALRALQMPPQPSVLRSATPNLGN